MLLVAIMHRPRFVRKAFADIVGVLDDVIAQLLDLGAQLALLRHHQRGRFGRRRVHRCSRFHRHWRFLAALLAGNARRHDRLLHLGRAADRTGDKPALHLRIIGGRVLEPALERVALVAAERVADHAEPRTRCRWSGPALGSAMPKRRPCCSEGIVVRAVSTLAGSISAMNTPGSTPPSAMTTPQGSTISECPKVSRLFSCMPARAAANTKQPVSIARERSSTCQCASPVLRVKAEGTVRKEAPLSASARYSAGKRRS